MLVVDDSAFMRRSISQMINRDPDLEVVGSARDGADAVEKVKLLKPDLMTLDVEMPVMDGLEALRRIRRECDPRPAVLMCSSLTTSGSHVALKAMRLGAADIIAKDGSTYSSRMDEMQDELIRKLKAISGAKLPDDSPEAPTTVAPPVEGRVDLKRVPELVLIGSSTGGPPVLERILTSVPSTFPVPIVIAQHMPPMFTKTLSSRLHDLCKIPIRHGEATGALEPGTATIVAGGRQGRIVRSGSGRLGLEISDRPAEALYKPSVDVLFESASEVTREAGIAIVLTGMGNDGAMGAAKLRARSWQVVTQQAETCVVYGMPRAAVENGSSTASMAPASIGGLLGAIGAKFGNPPTSRRSA
ncbi:MAG: chemotaxis-specific protein-glutamate methyltransferase CheB [Phycisphaerales bacterium]|nr:chemotaxis-specific protein-glutamate methyltransferase CheB [Phycisphaerales bacterium]